ncbi:MAG: tRNA epoxyqueuosine(34) reductase QueG [Alicyclobacillaceae bacterium]|nr:tRNA epoxyqueuosine(34) reductase QueG [Alicyclobacillaceae bacterium]
MTVDVRERREAREPSACGRWELTLRELRELARAAGFDAAGATTADPFPELLPRLKAYAERGLTGFECADLQRRVEPRSLMPEARSIIAVAMAYLTSEGRDLAKRHPRRSRAREEWHGQVSVYAYGQDYHAVMRQRLDDLHRRLEDLLQRPVKALPAVDTSPLVDRRVAERAGIGWVGKNCMLYTPGHGSYVFLGALLVDVRIEPAASELPPQCGSCRRCLDACPTGALLAPGVIDARRCLSYVTQMKGIIPEEFREPMGRRIWGCDVCQWACPVNQDVSPSAHDEYRPQAEVAFPELVDILCLTNRAFTRRYGHTAAAWRGLRTWQRNALIALGNCRDERAIPHIAPFLVHEREELRASAAWALRRIGSRQARALVLAAYARERSDVVRREMEWALDGDEQQPRTQHLRTRLAGSGATGRRGPKAGGVPGEAVWGALNPGIAEGKGRERSDLQSH